MRRPSGEDRASSEKRNPRPSSDSRPPLLCFSGRNSRERRNPWSTRIRAFRTSSGPIRKFLPLRGKHRSEKNHDRPGDQQIGHSIFKRQSSAGDRRSAWKPAAPEGIGKTPPAPLLPTAFPDGMEQRLRVHLPVQKRRLQRSPPDQKAQRGKDHRKMRRPRRAGCHRGEKHQIR